MKDSKRDHDPGSLMFLFLPYSTDAPVYHRPWAVCGLIAANLICFFITGYGDYASHENWLLQTGHVNPLEWFTASFFHFGWGHLLINMLFLWTYGLIVEGKIGWQRFLMVYFGIAVVHGLVSQVMLLGASAAATAGASAVLFGLGAMAMVWAPRNEIQTLWGIWVILPIYRVTDISVVVFVGLFVLYNLASIAVNPVAVSSQLFHLLGAVIGTGVAVWMLKNEHVDCENWDLLSVSKGTHRNSSAFVDHKTAALMAMKTPEEAEDADRVKVSQAKRVKKLDRLIEEKKSMAALRTLQQILHYDSTFELDCGPHEKLIDGLFKSKMFEEVVPLIEQFAERYPDKADASRIKLAYVLIDTQERPRAGQRILEAIDISKLSENKQKQLQMLHTAAQKMINDGVIELEGRSW